MTASAETSASPPLAGLVVLDATQIYNGPYATFLMAMAGAEVLKVEPPGGEHLRKRGGAGQSGLPFATLNANKRSLALDLKTPAGAELFRRLADGADVVVENFTPGVMDRLGLGYAALSARNPRLVYASGSGYGLDGPYRDYPAMDLTIQAMSGLMSITGFPGEPPVKAGGAVADFFAGIHLYGAVLTALYQRERTGRGQLVEVSMLESIYASLTSNLGALFAAGRSMGATGNRHGGLSLCPYNVYPAADGHLAILCSGDAHWRNLVRALDLAALAEHPGYDANAGRVADMEKVDGAIAAATAARGRDELFALLMRHHVPAAPVRTLDEVVADPHLFARGMLQRIDHPEYGPLVLQASPLRLHGAPGVAYRTSRPLGADTAGVLREKLALSEAELADLHEAGAF